MDDRKTIDYEIADVITGKPHEFTVGRKLFRIYPVTLAKTFALKRYMDLLSFNNDILKTNPYLESMRLVQEHRNCCCEILAIHTTPNTYKDLYNTQTIAYRRNVFEKMKDEDLATLFIHVLTSDKTDAIISHLKLDKEQERMRKVMEVKNKDNKNNISFGGLTIFGSFIGQLKEMGYSDNEILYERGYSFLRLMLADKMTSIYLTDEEQGKLPALTLTGMDANDPVAARKIISNLEKRGIKTGTQ